MKKQKHTRYHLADKQEQAHAREQRDRSWNEVLWDGTKTFTGEMTGYYDLIRASTGVDPVTGVEYTAVQRVAYAGLAAAGFIPFVGWAGRAIKGGKGIYAAAKGVKAVNTSLDIYKAANTFSSVKNVEMGIYGFAAATGVSEYITGKDLLGNELNVEQRSASLAQGIFACIPFVPSVVSKGNYITKQTMQKISNMNLTSGSNTFQPFSQNQGALQKWLGKSHVQPAFAGNVPEVPIRVMDTRNINKKLDVVSNERGSVTLGKGTSNLGNVIADISKVSNVDEALQIVKSSNISQWADADRYELISDTFKKADWTEADIAKLQHSIAEESGLIGKYYDDDMNIIWPGTKGDPNIDGFVNGISKPESLQVGATIDRYGHPGGAYLSPEGTSYGARALKPGTKETSSYFVYEVLKPIEVNAEEIAPWLGQTGRGIQYHLGSGKSVQQLIDDGFLKVVKEVIK